MTTTSSILHRTTRPAPGDDAFDGRVPRRQRLRRAARGAPWAGPALVVLGAWGGAVAYFGPVLGIGQAGAAPWHMSTAHTVLNLVPGAATVVGGLGVTLGARGRGAPARRAGALLALAAGAWFILGFAAYPVLLGGPAPAPGSTGGGALDDLGSVAAYGRGVGVLVCVLAAVALARPGLPRPLPAPAGSGDAAEALGPAGDDGEPADVPVAALVTGHWDLEEEGEWRPRLRPRVTRLVPGGRARVGWRPGFMSDQAPVGAPTEVGPVAGGAGPGVPGHGGRGVAGLPQGWLRPGEWVVASFGRLALRGSAPHGSARASAAVTNRRVVVDTGGRGTREWPLDAVAPEVGDAPANPVVLADDVSLEFSDPGAARDFTTAVQAAGQASAGDAGRD